MFVGERDRLCSEVWLCTDLHNWNMISPCWIREVDWMIVAKKATKELTRNATGSSTWNSLCCVHKGKTKTTMQPTGLVWVPVRQRFSPHSMQHNQSHTQTLARASRNLAFPKCQHIPCSYSISTSVSQPLERKEAHKANLMMCELSLPLRLCA